LKPKKPRDSGLIINVPLELARDIFSESGDLPAAKFPATMILADTIGKALSSGREENTKRPKPTILSKTKKTTIPRKRLYENPILTQ
jgi:hypothetical protein